jgi:hypothetical protein
LANRCSNSKQYFRSFQLLSSETDRQRCSPKYQDHVAWSDWYPPRQLLSSILYSTSIHTSWCESILGRVVLLRVMHDLFGFSSTLLCISRVFEYSSGKCEGWKRRNFWVYICHYKSFWIQVL